MIKAFIELKCWLQRMNISNSEIEVRLIFKTEIDARRAKAQVEQDSGGCVPCPSVSINRLMGMGIRFQYEDKRIGEV